MERPIVTAELVSAFKSVSSALINATYSESSRDRVLTAMLLIPLIQALNSFVDSFKDVEEENKAEDSSEKNPLDILSRLI